MMPKWFPFTRKISIVERMKNHTQLSKSIHRRKIEMKISLFPSAFDTTPTIFSGTIEEIAKGLTNPIMGTTNKKLPAGLQFLGRPFGEPEIIKFAYAYEQATKHRHSPGNFPPLE